MADPHVVADGHLVRASLLEETMIALDAGDIIFRAIGEAVQRWPVHRMIGRADPHVRGDGAELADHRIRHRAAAADVRVVAEGRVIDVGRAENLAASAHLYLAQLHVGCDDGFSDLGSDGERSVHGGLGWRRRRHLQQLIRAAVCRFCDVSVAVRRSLPRSSTLQSLAMVNASSRPSKYLSKAALNNSSSGAARANRVRQEWNFMSSGEPRIA
jgi:hypothetical protein